MSSFTARVSCTQLVRGIRDVPPRGGASLVASEAHGVVLFGGADRGQGHFNDTAILQKTRREWRRRETKGDVPTPRSGHAAASCGKFMFLFGGIDFAEEAAYNDSYVLNLETLEWKYVGEAGAEIPARNSHSLAIVQGEGEGGRSSRYIVVFGGASPELGVLGETYYAVLPDTEAEIESEEFFLTWKLLTISTALPGPEAREMHSTCVTPRGSMIIAGGRNEQGTVLSDVWELRPAPIPPPGSVPPVGDVLVWRKRTDLTLEVPRCAHGAAVLCLPPSDAAQLCIVGGFTGLAGPQGMPDGLCFVSLEELPGEGEGVGGAKAWSAAQGVKTIGPRFGIAVCNAPSWIDPGVIMTPPTSPTKEDSTSLALGLGLGLGLALEAVGDVAGAGGGGGESSVSGASGASGERSEAAPQSLSPPVDSSPSYGFRGMLLFGGVDVERDFADVWLFQPAAASLNK